MSQQGNTIIKFVPRRAWQTFTLFLIVAGASFWWYIETRWFWFLGLLAVVAIAGFISFRDDIKHVRAGNKDAHGIVTFCGGLKRWEKFFLLSLISFPLVPRAYAMAAEATLTPSTLKTPDFDPVLPFVFAATALALAIWVESSSERIFWILATANFSIEGLRSLVLHEISTPGFVGKFTVALWNAGSIAYLLVLLYGLRLILGSRAKPIPKSKSYG